MKLSISIILAAGCVLTTLPVRAAEPIPASIASKAAQTPKLIVSTPDPDILKGGYVYLPFEVENIAIQPVYVEIAGEAVLKSIPPVGHLHVMVDDAGWKWIHASIDPIYIGQLSPGPHRLELELVDAAHTLIETKTITIDVPDRS